MPQKQAPDLNQQFDLTLERILSKYQSTKSENSCVVKIPVVAVKPLKKSQSHTSGQHNASASHPQQPQLKNKLSQHSSRPAAREQQPAITSKSKQVIRQIQQTTLKGGLSKGTQDDIVLIPHINDSNKVEY